MNTLSKNLAVIIAVSSIASITKAALPDSGMEIDKGRTAILITDPQNNFLSPGGVAWSVEGKNCSGIGSRAFRA